MVSGVSITHRSIVAQRVRRLLEGLCTPRRSRGSPSPRDPLHPWDADDLAPGQLPQLNDRTGSTLYKFLERYPDGSVTVELLFTWPRGSDAGHAPDRTRVSQLTADQLFDFISPADRLVDLYEEHWGDRQRSGCGRSGPPTGRALSRRAGRPRRPAVIHSVVDQIQHAGLDDGVHPRRDRAGGQP